MAGDLDSILGLRGSFRTRGGGRCAVSHAGVAKIVPRDAPLVAGPGFEWLVGRAEAFRVVELGVGSSQLIAGGASAMVDAIVAGNGPCMGGRARGELAGSLDVRAVFCSLGFFDTGIRVLGEL